MRAKIVRATALFVVYSTLVLILATVGVSCFWRSPGWSATEAAKRLPAVPPEVFTAYKRCEDASLHFEEQNLHQICEPIVGEENGEVRIDFEPVTSLKGYWRGSASDFSWEHGHLPADTANEEWGTTLTGINEITTLTVNPSITVVIPNLTDDELNRLIPATASLTVVYPAKAGSGHFDDLTVQRQRAFSLFVVSADEMQVLKRYVDPPAGTRDVVLGVLTGVDMIVFPLFIVVVVVAFWREWQR